MLPVALCEPFEPSIHDHVVPTAKPLNVTRIVIAWIAVDVVTIMRIVLAIRILAPSKRK